MNVTNTRLVQRCHRCGQEWIKAHFCQALNAPYGEGAKAQRPLTEPEVRSIVRDELQRAGLLNSPNA